MNAETHKIVFDGASVARASKRSLGGNSNQGSILIKRAKGAMTMSLDITYLNQDFLYSLGNLDTVEVEVTIRKTGVRPISQPNIPTKNR